MGWGVRRERCKTEMEGRPSPRPSLILACTLASCVTLGESSGPEPQFPHLSSGEKAPTSSAAVRVLSTSAQLGP